MNQEYDKEHSRREREVDEPVGLPQLPPVVKARKPWLSGRRSQLAAVYRTGRGGNVVMKRLQQMEMAVVVKVKNLGCFPSTQKSLHREVIQ